MLSNSDKSKILALAHSSFGKNYLSKNQLENIFMSTNKFICVERLNDDIVGFCLVYVLPYYKISDHIFLEYNEIEPLFNLNKNIAYRKMTVVDTNHRRKGIGKQLIQQSEKRCIEKVNRICTTIWHSGEEQTMVHLLERFNYKKRLTKQNYWSKNSLEEGYDCRVCGAPPCTCSASIFVKELKRG